MDIKWNVYVNIHYHDPHWPSTLVSDVSDLPRTDFSVDLGASGK